MMQIIIFVLLFSAILIGGLWFHDVWLPPEGRAERKQWGHSKPIEDTTEQTSLVAERAAALALHAEAKG